MKVVILAGGLGTRLMEETVSRPKPMVEIGGRPILWHIMKIYSSHGLNDFIICAGYKGHMIKQYFADYALHTSDVTFDIRENSVEVHNKNGEPWRVTVVDTGDESMTGGRIKRVQKYVGDEMFCVAYGDGVGDIDITRLISFHNEKNRLATITAVQPPGRFGAICIEQDRVIGFEEKPQGDGGWINGGFFVVSPEVFDYIEADDTIWEQTPLNRLVREKQLSVYKHHGFWQPMDTLRDMKHLEELWENVRAPWKTWKT